MKDKYNYTNFPQTQEEFIEMITSIGKALEQSSPKNPLEAISRTIEFERAIKEHLKDFIVEDADPVEEAKRKEERRWIAKQNGQKKFRKNGNNRKKTRGRK